MPTNMQAKSDKPKPDRSKIFLMVMDIFIIAAFGIMYVRISDLSAQVRANSFQIQEMRGLQNMAVQPIRKSEAPLTKVPDAKEVNIQMTKEGFSLKGIQIFAGQKVNLLVTNSDTTVHSFNIEGLDIKSGPIDPGKTMNFVLDRLPDGSASFEYYSDYGDDAKNNDFKGSLLVLKK